MAYLFRTKLRAIGVGAISAMDMPFDPNLEQTVGMIPVDDASKNTMVVEVLRASSSYTRRRCVSDKLNRRGTCSASSFYFLR